MTPNVFNLVRCIFYLYKSHRGHRFCIVVRHKHAGQLMLHTSISYIYINLHFQNKQHGNRKMAKGSQHGHEKLGIVCPS